MTSILGARLKALRKARKLTQVEVAAAIDYSRTAITGVESQGDDPGRILIERLAAFYGVTVGSLYDPGAPQLAEEVKDPDELALLRFWRKLDEETKGLILQILARGPRNQG